jgi:hypothetical protein
MRDPYFLLEVGADADFWDGWEVVPTLTWCGVGAVWLGPARNAIATPAATARSKAAMGAAIRTEIRRPRDRRMSCPW